MSLSSARLKLLFHPALLLSGIAIGAGLRRAGPGGGDPSPGIYGRETSLTTTASALHARVGGPGKQNLPAIPFSMERFQAAQGWEMHRMLAQVLPGADAALVRALAEDLAQRKLPVGERFPVWKAVFARWVELNGKEAIAWAREADAKSPGPGSDGMNQIFLTLTALRAWVRMDADTADAEFRKDNFKEAWVYFDELGSLDPGLAMARFKAHRKNLKDPTSTILALNDGTEESLLKKWAEREPEAALAMVMGDSPVNITALKALAEGRVSKDPAGCGKWLATLSADQRKWALAGISRAASGNPAVVAKILDDLPRDKLSGDTAMEVAAAMAEKSSEEAQAWVKNYFPQGIQRDYALARVAQSLMAKDLRATVTIMDSLGWKDWEGLENKRLNRISPGKEGGPEVIGEGAERNAWTPSQVASSLLQRLAREDPALGVRCLEKADPKARGQLLESFAPEWFQRDPEAALQWLGSLTSAKVDAQALSGALDRFPDFSAEAMRDQVLRVPEGPFREALVRESLRGAPVTDPQSSLEQLPFTDPASRRAATEEIVAQWAETAPREALDHFLATPDPAPDSVATMVHNWTDYDPAAASTWAAALPPGPGRDGAIRGMIASLTDPDLSPDFPAALIWSLEISDSAQRLKTARDLLKNLPGSQEEVKEVRETLARPGALAEEDRQTLLKLLPP